MTEAQAPTGGYYRFDLARFGAVQCIIPYSGDAEFDAESIRNSIRAVCEALQLSDEQKAELARNITGGMLPKAQEQQQNPESPMSRPQNGPPRQQGGQGQYARNFPILSDLSCDICGGPVGRRPKSGKMRTDTGVCLTKCTDPNPGMGNDYIHTVTFLDEDQDEIPTRNVEVLPAEREAQPF